MAGLSRRRARRASVCCAVITLWTVSAAQARPARCFTTDEGSYPCDFQSTGADGSFEISARGKPTYHLVIDTPGTAFGYVKLGSRNTALPGQYKHDPKEPGCWLNESTSTKICAK